MLFGREMCIRDSRELIANSIESMAQINLFDGLVLLGSCDKIVPGMLMAAARLDIPCIFLPGGPMEGGVEFDGRQADQTSSTEAYGMLSAGKITEEEYVSLENTACPGCGSCSYLGTANTMCALAEALGMTLPDGGTAPATSSIRMMKAEETGVKIMELVEKNITSRQIITDSSIPVSYTHLSALRTIFSSIFWMNVWRWAQSCPMNMSWRTGSASAGERSGKR